jgi:GNAT superfamily N-acetyltransferase
LFRGVLPAAGKSCLSYARDTATTSRQDEFVSNYEIRLAAAADLLDVAALRWAQERGVQDVRVGQAVTDFDEFAADFIAWAASHPEHHCVVAREGAGREGADPDGGRVVGMAWLAELPRVPSPISFDRAGGDIQSVYVSPDNRNEGIGAAMVQRIVELAGQLGLMRVTVHSSGRAIPVYGRAGFIAKENLLALELG